jgi:hypothetical protein
VILEICKLGEINLLNGTERFWPGFEIDLNCCRIARIIRLFFFFWSL